MGCESVYAESGLREREYTCEMHLCVSQYVCAHLQEE